MGHFALTDSVHGPSGCRSFVDAPVVEVEAEHAHDRASELEHVRLLAAARRVPVVEVPDLAYSCIGLIRPAGRGAA